MQVALDPPQLAGLGVEHRRAALAQRLHLAAQLAGLRRADEPGDHRSMEHRDELRQGRRDRQQGNPAEHQEPGPLGRRALPGGRGQQRQRRAPDRDDQEELDDDQGEVDADVQDVAPARLVDELGADEVHEAATQRLVGMRDQGHRIGEAGPTSFEPGDEPRSLDAEDDQDDPDPGEEARDTRRQGRHDRCERDDADEEPDQDECDRAPGRRMEGGQQERADRVPDACSVAPRRKRDPRRSERRFAGDASREQAGQDKKEPDDEDRRGDH